MAIVEHYPSQECKCDTYKIASPLDNSMLLAKYAFGRFGKKRPSFARIEGTVMHMTTEDSNLELSFGPLNYDYVDKLPADDISVYGIQEFGKFFYEYGRAILANLTVCATRLDWIVDDVDFEPVTYYYNTLYNLDQKADSVIETFKKTISYDDKKNPVFAYDFRRAAADIFFIKDKIAESKEANDIKNTKLLSYMYTGVYFTLIGCILNFGSEHGIDVLEYMQSDSEDSMMKVIDAILTEVKTDDQRISVIKLIYVFYAIENLYRNTSGLESGLDPMLHLVENFCSTFIKKITNTDQMQVLADVTESFSVCANYDPINDMNGFISNGTISNDCTNLWEFGREYFRSFSLTTSSEIAEDDVVNIAERCKPQIKSYLDNCAEGKYNEDTLNKGFVFVSTILNGLENNKLCCVNPGLILQLTLVASVFRSQGKADNKISASIDIIDTIISSLYRLWFNTGKFFIQPNRPHYCHESALETLDELRKETNDILCVYFEYVRFGQYDKMPKSEFTLFTQYLQKRHDCSDKDGCANFIINELFPPVDQEVFIRECATRGIRSFAYTALTDNTKSDLTVEKLSEFATSSPLPNNILVKLSATHKEYTGIKIVDAMIDIIDDAKSLVQETPGVYMLAVYDILYECVDEILRNNNVGNYFDFGRADDASALYKIESIVSEYIVKPASRFADQNL